MIRASDIGHPVTLHYLHLEKEAYAYSYMKRVSL